MSTRIVNKLDRRHRWVETARGERPYKGKTIFGAVYHYTAYRCRVCGKRAELIVVSEYLDLMLRDTYAPTLRKALEEQSPLVGLL